MCVYSCLDTNICVKVLWILFSFVWGLIQLVQTRGSADGGKDDWSFGQVVPVVLICAPLLTFYQFFYPGIFLGRLSVGRSTDKQR